MPFPIYLGEECCQPPHLGSQWAEFNFNLVPGPSPPSGGGLVPCGRGTDDPSTPWKETDPCQLKHLFILVRNIISFFFERIVPLSLVLLLIATGVIFYLSWGLPETTIKIKELWLAAGKGYLIIFLAWLIVNFILVILGYKFGAFGHWWQIKF
jgi:hypothetical protein